MPHVRCSKCLGRRTLQRHPDQYQRLPRCARCNRQMTNIAGDKTKPHYRIDKYRPKFERGFKLVCDPSKSGCRGYSFIHRKGSGYCDFNADLTLAQLKERHERGTWA